MITYPSTNGIFEKDTILVNKAQPHKKKGRKNSSERNREKQRNIERKREKEKAECERKSREIKSKE